MVGYYLVKKEGNVLFIDTLNTFCIQLYIIRHMVKDRIIKRKLTAFQLVARDLLYAPFHRQNK